MHNGDMVDFDPNKVLRPDTDANPASIANLNLCNFSLYLNYMNS